MRKIIFAFVVFVYSVVAVGFYSQAASLADIDSADAVFDGYGIDVDGQVGFIGSLSGYNVSPASYSSSGDIALMSYQGRCAYNVSVSQLYWYFPRPYSIPGSTYLLEIVIPVYFDCVLSFSDSLIGTAVLDAVASPSHGFYIQTRTAAGNFDYQYFSADVLSVNVVGLSGCYGGFSWGSSSHVNCIVNLPFNGAGISSSYSGIAYVTYQYQYSVNSPLSITDIQLTSQGNDLQYFLTLSYGTDSLFPAYDSYELQSDIASLSSAVASYSQSVNNALGSLSGDVVSQIQQSTNSINDNISRSSDANVAAVGAAADKVSSSVSSAAGMLNDTLIGKDGDYQGMVDAKDGLSDKFGEYDQYEAALNQVGNKNMEAFDFGEALGVLSGFGPELLTVGTLVGNVINASDGLSVVMFVGIIFAMISAIIGIFSFCNAHFGRDPDPGTDIMEVK